MALMLYSGVLKNLEMVPDPVKRRHLACVLGNWGFFTMQSLLMVPLLAKHRRMRINGVTYEILLPRHLTEVQVARAIYFELPGSVSRLVMSVLGTEKLERQLIEPGLEEANEHLIITFFRKTLIADLKLGDWAKAQQIFARTAASRSRYLLEAFAHRLLDIYLLGCCKPDHELELRAVIGEAVGYLRASTPDERKRKQNGEIERLKRQSLIRRLRFHAREAKDGESGC